MEQQQQAASAAPAAGMTPEQAHTMLGGKAVLSRASFYAGLNRGDIPALRVGRRFIIPRHAFMKWLENASAGVAR